MLISNAPLAPVVHFPVSWRNGARGFALALLLAGMAVPDCCLSGAHAFGAGMETFTAICRAKA